MTSVEEKKEMTEKISEETSEKTVSEETQGITLNDIVAMRNIVNIASRRGAFGAEEFKDIGIIYNRIDTFVKANVKTKEGNGDGDGDGEGVEEEKTENVD